MTRRAFDLARHALSGLRRSPLRTALVALGVAIASGALVSMVAFALGVQAQAEAPFEKLGLLSQIRVMPKEDAPPLDDAALEKFEAIPGVMAAWPDFRISEILLRRGEPEKSWNVRGIGVPREVGLAGVLDAVLVAGGAFTVDGTEPEIIVARRTARELGFEPPESAVGGTVSLESSGLLVEPSGAASVASRAVDARVAGVYEMPIPAIFGAFDVALLPVDVARALPGAAADTRTLARKVRSGSSLGESFEAVVRAENPSHVKRVEAELNSMGYETRAVLSNIEDMRRFFVFIDVLLAAVGAVALVVAGLGILNTQLMSVLERFPEIGVYKALGASDGDVRVLFLAEAAAVGALGGAAGLVLARGVSTLLEIAANAYARSEGIEGEIAVFAFPAWLLAGALLFSIAVSVASGLYPASRAARVDPVRALRSGG